MISNSFIYLCVKARTIAKVDCPVDGKGFSQIVIKTGEGHICVSTISNVPPTKFFDVTTTPTNLRFNGGDNTVPKSLYLLAGSSDIYVSIFIEEVGSNPV